MNTDTGRNYFVSTFFSKVRYRRPVSVRPTVHPSVCPSVRPPFTIYVDPNIYDIQKIYSLKPFSKFTCSMTRPQGFRIYPGREQRWPMLLKITKPITSTFSPEPLGIFGQ